MWTFALCLSGIVSYRRKCYFRREAPGRILKMQMVPQVMFPDPEELSCSLCMYAPLAG